MPVNLSFEVAGAQPCETAKVRSFFERLGWEATGVGSFRYPRIGASGHEPAEEDWFNHVVPALMLFRTYALAAPHRLKAVTLDAHSSTAYRRASGFGAPPMKVDEIPLREPGSVASAPANGDGDSWFELEEWLDGIVFPAAGVYQTAKPLNHKEPSHESR